MKYQSVIGLEIHAEMLTNSKVFCTCSAEFGGAENSRVCPRCSGLPGTLPVFNRGAAYLAARAGFALECTVNNYSAFDRKNYFYPDLPKAYQITQFTYPICTDGKINVGGRDIRINRIHIEEDAGKLVHDDYEGISMADYNRCGVPLIEIVTEPDIRTAEEARDFVEQIALRLKYAGVCDSRMEQGSLRVDVNISLMPYGSDVFGTRAEIKNLNSLKSIVRAIEYETERQSEILDRGGEVVQETRRYNDNRGMTNSLRSKEEAHDYRYFPEPDIPPVFLSDAEIAEIRNSMPEMPGKRLERYTNEYGLREEDARLLISDKSLSDFYDETVRIYPSYKPVANLVLVELLRLLNESEASADNLKFTPDALARTVKMADEGRISKNAAKDILKILFSSGGDPVYTAGERGFIMSDDEDDLAEIIDKVISENKDSVESYKAGNQKVFGFLMGQVVREAGKSANPKLAKDLLMKKIREVR
ncbi:MAG: Asp-tRNA(Asn)/Glu-tRNA(Gln) amidotransferase subunit GatB [Oscillospiraceae bacterium]|nr:Asp-tRNA(Asn)/Glu-tRNA(Gln) amidotransferase subunit GatB [Oscillospiraceae bacterium]